MRLAMTEEKYEVVELDLPLDQIGRLAIQAHEQDMKLNDYINDIIREYCEKVIDDHENKK